MKPIYIIKPKSGLPNRGYIIKPIDMFIILSVVDISKSVSTRCG